MAQVTIKCPLAKAQTRQKPTGGRLIKFAQFASCGSNFGSCVPFTYNGLPLCLSLAHLGAYVCTFRNNFVGSVALFVAVVIPKLLITEQAAH